ncbi:UvrD-helicase domain-containing protein [bacterium]|nr:UvrD-helicase domain-containing protein [bacterium]
MPERSWTDDQLQAITVRDRELAVGAAAGSGKTAVLIERVVRAALGRGPDGPLEPVALDRMLIVTFTRAAAAELRARLHAALADELARKRTAGEDTAQIRSQLALLPAARISTIHSFCSTLIRSYGHATGSSLSRLLNEDETKLARHELAGELLDGLLAQDDDFGAQMRELALAWGGSEGVGSEDISGGERGSSLRRSVLRLADFLRSLEDPQHWWDELCALTELDPEVFDPAHQLIRALERMLREWADEVLRQDAETAERLSASYSGCGFLSILQRRREVLSGLSLAKGWEAVGQRFAKLREKQDDIAYKPDLLTSHARDLDKEDEFTKAWLRARNEPVAKSAKEWIDYFSQDWAELAMRENTARGLLQVLQRATLALLEHYDDYKRSRAVMDYSDLEHSAFDILCLRDADGILQRDSQGELLPSDSALDLRSQLRMVMVDEYQDTNPLQDAILRLVTPSPVGEEGRPAFVVGDVKQSIYAFRLATPGLFTERLRELGSGRPDGLAITLNRNFRSRESIVRGVNAVFSGLLTEDFGGQDYSANRLVYGAGYPESGSELKPRLHLVYSDLEDGEEDADLATDRLVYRRVAGILRGIHASGQLVTDPHDGTQRPVQWRDMVVLMRSTSGRSETLLSELELAGVPAYAPGRSGFYERPEVSDVLALLRVIDNPLQDIPLAAVLSGPALGLDINELARIAMHDPERQAPPLWDRLQGWLLANPDDANADALRDFLSRLDAWRSVARSQPLGQLIWQLYHEAGLLPAAAALERGSQRIANLGVLHELARGFEQNERQGLARFLHFLEHSRRSAGDLGEAPLLSEAQDVVRLMTVHQSKGLEFPVVILPDIHRRFNMMDLANDVVWERGVGIGGRYVRLRGDNPLRSDTIGRRVVGQALRRQMAAEELRILYVALTRARERLELVAAVKSDFADKLSDSHPGPLATCALDWIAPQLAGVINPQQFSGGNSWEMLDALPALKDDVVLEEQDLVDQSELDAALIRVNWQDPLAGLAGLPRKLTVTGMERLLQPPEDADADAELPLLATEVIGADEPSDDLAAEQPAPQFDPLARERAMQYGTAMHLMMAQLDLLHPPDEHGLEELVQRLLAEGLLDPSLAERIDRDALLRCCRDISHSGLISGMELHRELPVSMSLPAAALDPLPAGIDARLAAEAQQLVLQGTLDLLAVGEGRLLVLDYKTDRTGRRFLLERHTAQLGWYCRMAQAMLPDHRVQWALYGFNGAGIVGPFDWQA